MKVYAIYSTSTDSYCLIDETADILFSSFGCNGPSGRSMKEDAEETLKCFIEDPPPAPERQEWEYGAVYEAETTEEQVFTIAPPILRFLKGE